MTRHCCKHSVKTTLFKYSLNTLQFIIAPSELPDDHRVKQDVYQIDWRVLGRFKDYLWDKTCVIVDNKRTEKHAEHRDDEMISKENLCKLCLIIVTHNYVTFFYYSNLTAERLIFRAHQHCLSVIITKRWPDLTTLVESSHRNSVNY